MMSSFRFPALFFLGLLLSIGHDSPLHGEASNPTGVDAEPASSDGLLRLDVTVTDKSGDPATELKPEDFTLLDNGKQAKFASFRAFDGAPIYRMTLPRSSW